MKTCPDCHGARFDLREEEATRDRTPLCAWCAGRGVVNEDWRAQEVWLASLHSPSWRRRLRRRPREK